jgi:hypothetical protein
MDNSRLLGEAIQHPGLVLLLVLCGSLVAQVLYSSVAPMRGLFSRRCFRDGLEKRITPSQLGKMLGRRGIDLQYYLFSQPPAEIEKHMCNCKRCDSLEQCDCYLDSKKMDNRIDLSFCRNNDAILKIKHQQDNLYILRNRNL